MTVKHTMRDALIESRRIVADALNAFGPCDHSFGICNCDMKRSIEASDAALADDDAARGAMREGDASPCPQCNNEYLAIRTDIYKDGREFVYCDQCGAMATHSLWQASRAAAPQTSAMYAADDLLRSGLDAYNAAQGTAIDRVAAAIRTVVATLNAAAPQSVEPYGCVTTQTHTGQQVFYRWPRPPYLDNASECVMVYLAPPSTPTDAEWLEEAMRWAIALEKAGRELTFATASDRAEFRAKREAALAALREHLSTRPAQAEEIAFAKLRAAALEVLSWIEAAHRPPVRDPVETGRMVLVRLHALADLHATMSAPPTKAKEQ